jgi:hypothetical protein
VRTSTRKDRVVPRSSHSFIVHSWRGPQKRCRESTPTCATDGLTGERPPLLLLPPPPSLLLLLKLPKLGRRASSSAPRRRTSAFSRWPRLWCRTTLAVTPPTPTTVSVPAPTAWAGRFRPYSAVSSTHASPAPLVKSAAAAAVGPTLTRSVRASSPPSPHRARTVAPRPDRHSIVVFFVVEGVSAAAGMSPRPRRQVTAIAPPSRRIRRHRRRHVPIWTNRCKRAPRHGDGQAAHEDAGAGAGAGACGASSGASGSPYGRALRCGRLRGSTAVRERPRNPS